MALTFCLKSLRKELQVVLTSDNIPSIPSEDDLEYEEQDNPTLFDLIRRYPDKTYKDVTQIQEDMRLAREAKKAEDKIIKDDRGPLDLTLQLEKIEKRAQEAEGELSIMKGIETNRVKELEKRISGLVDEIDQKQIALNRYKKEKNDMFLRVTDLLNENDSFKDLIRSRDYTKHQDYQFLVDENKELHKEIDNLKRDKEKRMIKTREAGF